MNKRSLALLILSALFICCLALFGCEKNAHIHEYTDTTINPTCTEKGSIVYSCECGDSYTKELPALGHTEAIDQAVAPTCSKTGLTEGKHCSVCNAILKEQEIIGPHIYENSNQCSVCEYISIDCFSFGLTFDGTYEIFAKNTKTIPVNVVIPAIYKEKAVTAIAIYGFADCSSLKTVVLPDSIISIGNFAFEHCPALTSVEIGKGLTTIAAQAFYSCKSLTSIVIPSSVNFVGAHAFTGCVSLTIYCEAKDEEGFWASSWNISNCPVVWGYKG